MRWGISKTGPVPETGNILNTPTELLPMHRLAIVYHKLNEFLSLGVAWSKSLIFSYNSDRVALGIKQSCIRANVVNSISVQIGLW